MLNVYSISNISYVTPAGLVKNGIIKINKRRIDSFEKPCRFDIKPQQELYMYPGLINAHDHLRGNYLPKVGPAAGTYYLNWAAWDDDLKAAPVYAEREKNTIDDLYQLSAYKNLFSGVVTVNDHFPHHLNDPHIPHLPVRVIREYTLSHACSSFSLKWGESIETEHRWAKEKNYPFITHCEEGFDLETQSGVDRLEELSALDDHDILVHCIGFSDKDIKKVKDAGANIVWCPQSNIFMFNVTCKIKKIIAAGINVCLGTDASHSGSANLLKEMKFAHAIYNKMYGQKLADKKIFEMVTINPAKAFRMEGDIGSIEKGKLADLLLIRPGYPDPYKALVLAEMQDIELLIMAGDPILGSMEYKDLFIERGVDFTEISINNRKMAVKGDPAGLMKRIQKAVKKKKELDFIPIDAYIYS